MKASAELEEVEPAERGKLIEHQDYAGVEP